MQPDYMGFIFYPKSPRYCKSTLDRDLIQHMPGTIKKIGVFVNENIGTIRQIINDYSLDYAQLHGNETAEYCKELFFNGIQLIKAFHIDIEFDFQSMAPFVPYCQYFLFDTRTPAYGGSGRAFDWNILLKYSLDKPFFLSGGIDLDDIPKIHNISHLNIHGLDINSRFETAPGFKNLSKIAAMMYKIKEYNQQNIKTE